MPYTERIASTTASFRAAVHYSDGVSIAITKITQGTDTNTGAGAMPGKPVTTFTVVLSNHTSAAINLDQVVVSVVYGSPAAHAVPVDGPTTADFSGTVAPGKQANAVYAFSIPTANLGDTTMGIDFDGKHTVAVFTGPA
jgi:hypothetical protein